MKRICGVALMVSSGLATQSWAQDGVATEPASLEEVVVTALRRETIAADTPAALTVITSEALDRSGTKDVADLQHLGPGLTTVRQGPSNVRLVVRGVQSVGEPTVGLYYDEVPVSGLPGAGNDAAGSTSMVSLVDVDRIEILRGPQGALYGSGAMTGAVRVLWRKPEFTNGAEVAGELSSIEGGGSGWTGRFIGNIGLGDRVAARATLWSEQRPTYVHNDFLNRSVAGGRTDGARLQLRARGGESLTLDAALTWQSSEGDIPLWALDAGDYIALNQARLLNDDEQVIGAVTATYDAPGVRYVFTASRAVRELDQVAADVSYQFGSLVGNAAVCSRIRGGGGPCSPAQMADFNNYVRTFVPSVVYPRQDATTDTAEFRAASTGSGDWAWTTGVFWSERQVQLDNSGLRARADTGELVDPPSYTFRREADDSLEQVAAFGELSWRLHPALELTAGGRAFRYEREVSGATTQGLDLINARVLPTSVATATDEGLALKFNAAFRPESGGLIYAEASEGFRPGGANQVLDLPSALVPYGPDRLWSYQLGYKGSHFDDRLTLDLAAFRIDWDDMQVAGSRPDGLFRFISNAGRARVDGFEAQAVARLEPLTLRAHLTTMDARLVENQASPVVVAPGRAGDRIPYTPRRTAGLEAIYAFQPMSGLAAEVSVGASYVGGSASEFRPDNPFYRIVPDHTLVTARWTLAPASGDWEVYASVDNLTDDLAIQGVTANGITLGRTLVVTAPPRTVSLGLRLRY